MHLARRGARRASTTPLFAEWLGDLRLLGMRPIVVLVGDAHAPGRERLMAFAVAIFVGRAGA